MRRPPQTARPTEVRCAIYTRKSTEEGLGQSFNSLDAQRESAEAYIRSQQHEGWVCVLTRYDDGGFSGGNMDRPALRRLIADIEAGKVDCVLVHKVDRLSRSLLDFARLIEVFDRLNVAFVSVTQQFCTTQSLGRLTLHILLSFAQFEREIISERTRDKIASTRRKGKWTGGRPILGYDVDRTTTKLVVNPDEAVRVRVIFELYLELQSLSETVKELHRRGWQNKSWVTRSGVPRGSADFDKSTVHKLLTNVLYVGKVRYKSEVHNGEHPAIVDANTFAKVQSMLDGHGRGGGGDVRNKHGALLKGLLFCSACERTMTPASSTKRGTKVYRYYTCTAAQKRGWASCPNKSVPAGEIERFVVDQIQTIAEDEELLGQTLEQAQQQTQEQLRDLEVESRILQREATQAHAEVQRLSGSLSPGETDGPAIARLADLQDRIRIQTQRAVEIDGTIEILRRDQVHPNEVAEAFADFESLWSTLTYREHSRVMQLLIDRVVYDGTKGTVAITFHPTGIQTLTQEMTSSREIA